MCLEHKVVDDTEQAVVNNALCLVASSQYVVWQSLRRGADQCNDVHLGTLCLFARRHGTGGWPLLGPGPESTGGPGDDGIGRKTGGPDEGRISVWHTTLTIDSVNLQLEHAYARRIEQEDRLLFSSASRTMCTVGMMQVCQR